MIKNALDCTKLCIRAMKSISLSAVLDARGRYLFDTVKGSDFIRLPTAPGAPPAPTTPGFAGGRVLLDFNYAYNPSCAYDPRWVCPLAPPENRLPVAIRAGERKFHD